MLPKREPENGVAARRLLAAILRRAVLDFVLYADCEKKDELRYELHTEAAAWLFSDQIDASPGVEKYTYLQVCAMLELDPKAIREQALQLTRKDLHRFSGDCTTA